ALPRAESFYLLYSAGASEKLYAWLQEDCQDVREFSNVLGLPTGWKMIFVREALRDSARKHYPFLSFSSGRRIRFSSGMRITVGNNYFAFAPPSVMLDGKDGTEEIHCNGQPLTPATNGGDRYE